jgi:hypothetical protein
MLNKDFIQVYPDFLAKKDVNNLNLFLYQKGPVLVKEIHFLEKLNDAEIEVATNFEIKNKTIQKIMKDAEAKVIEHITNVYFPELGYEAKLDWSRPLELIRWGSAARLEDHTDAPPIDDYGFVPVSALIYVNDDYIGGEINFPEYDVEIKPKSNDLIVFSGSMVHNVGFVGDKTIKDQDQRRFTMPFFFDFTVKPF